MKEKSILDKPLFDIALDVVGWGITTAFKGAKAGITAIADNLPTEANKERKREEKFQQTLDGLEASRRSIIDAMVAGRRDQDIPLEEPIEETCDNLLYEQDELILLSRSIARYDPDIKILDKKVSEINDYKDLPIKTYKEFFTFKDIANKTLDDLIVAERKKAWAEDNYKDLMRELGCIPNFFSKDPYKVNYKLCLDANRVISDFLERNPFLDDDKVNELKELIDFTNKVYELNKYKMEQEEKEEARKRVEEDRQKAERIAREKAKIEQEYLEDIRDSVQSMKSTLDDTYNPFR